MKRVTAAMFDAIAEEHPLKHQNVYARRYVFRCASGSDIEIMFEADPDKAPPNVWMLASAAAPLLGAPIERKKKPSSELRTKIGKDGKPTYGRHSALEKMPQLGNADLVYFIPETLEEVGRILDALLAAARK
ncbi:hypothetical protein [Sediminibacterium sp.]|uniref:hypothetical protein n=1 Tax=Sediminibacterium sp. TaxID=1917865 RepID=UPI002736EE9F|nr:hypothetical protein [Sediminibacterium sp.]MDP3566415.1 hypothetical protein [Sediminibacterium sp.]